MWKLHFRTWKTKHWNQPNRKDVLVNQKTPATHKPIYHLNGHGVQNEVVLKNRSENSIFSKWLGYPSGNRRERVLSNKAKHRNLVFSNLTMKNNCKGVLEAISLSY